MIIDFSCKVRKENLRILIEGKERNIHIDPKQIDELILTKKSSVTSEVYKLKEDLNIIFFSQGMPVCSMSPLNNIPKILKNEELFNKISKYKRRKLTWLFAKSVCSKRIKEISRLNEKRHNQKVKQRLEEMRRLDRELIKQKERNKIMAIEGNIAKIFYSCLKEFSTTWRDNFKMRDRNSKDIINVLMNFTHSLLRYKIKYRLMIKGINPYHSYLHKNDRNEPFLVYDFSEFWLAYIDKLIFVLIENGIIKENSVNKQGCIKEEKKKKIIEKVNQKVPEKQIDKKIEEFKGFLEGKNNISWN